MVDEVLLKQEVNPTKDLGVSGSGSTSNEKEQGNKALVKNEGKILEHKEFSQNPRGCEEQGSVKNSNFTPKMEITENENDNLNKESQVLDQDKKTNSINGSSNHQNMNEKPVNLPIKDECGQGLELSR